MNQMRLRKLAIAGAAVVLVGASIVPEDALAYRGGGARASSFGGGSARSISGRYGGGRYAVAGRGYGYRGAAWRGAGYGAAAVGAAAVGTAAAVAATSPGWGWGSNWGWGGGPGYTGAGYYTGGPGGALGANAYYAPPAANTSGWYITGGGMACTPGTLILGANGLPFLCPERQTQ
jgi:hypothetical protein